MTKKRKEVQEYILKYIDKIVPGGENKKLYEDLFKKMNDDEFHNFMLKLKNKKLKLSVIVPNGSKTINMDIKRNIKIGKELGVEFFQHLIIGEHDDIKTYKTPNKFLIVNLPFRRAIQTLTKGVSVTKDDKHIDYLTGQVGDESRSSRVTFPEVQLLIGMGLEKSLKEMMKYRGGDTGARVAMNKLLQKQGIVTQEQLEEYSTGVVSTRTIKSYLHAMHLKNTL